MLPKIREIKENLKNVIYQYIPEDFLRLQKTVLLKFDELLWVSGL